MGRTKRDHLKRETRERDKNPTSNYPIPILGTAKKQTTCSSPAAGSRSPKSNLATCSSILPKHSQSTVNQGELNSNPITLEQKIEEALSGYNSGDEHVGQKDAQFSPEEWAERDETFIKVMKERGFIVKDMVEDGACLFRAISIQIYGDQDMHETIRQQTMDYIVG